MKKLSIYFWLIMSSVFLAQAQTVFINEIHYDNTGTDTGESIEIAGPAGTDLAQFSLELYNGSNGSLYDTEILSGTIPDQGNGYGTFSVSFPSNGIQNGSPDGIALVNNGSIVQFLSYEGSFSAVDGTALGISSTDIGVTETSDTPVGFSLQLIGEGSEYTDFTWNNPSEASFGLVNSGQTFVGGPAPVSVVFINEIHYDNDGTDTGEGVEVAGEAGTDLTGWTIVLYNGSGGALYNTIDLGGSIPDQQNGYGTISVSLPSNGLQNGAPDGLALVDNLGGVVEFLSYEGSFTAVGGPADGITSTDIGVFESGTTPVGFSLQLTGTGLIASDFTWTEPQAETFGQPNTGQTFGEEVVQAVKIHEVQGNGLQTPLNGQTVIVEAIVIGDYQQSDQLNGFFIQEEDADADADPMTSEGIFIYAPGVANVEVGDAVRIEGIAGEFFDQTQISASNIEVLSSSNTLPTSTTLSLPKSTETSFEPYEGMLVEFTQTLTVSEVYNLARFGEVVLSSGGRLFQPTNQFLPGSVDAIALQAQNDLNRILLDDGSSQQNPDPVIHPIGDLSASNTLRLGHTVANLSGVLSFSFSEYRILTGGGVDFDESANPRSSSPASLGGELKVASFNVLNYFNGDGLGGGFPTSRGADNAFEFERQRKKIIEALLAVDADIVGLMEIENDGYGENSAIADLVNGLNGALGTVVYSFVDPGVVQIGTDQIAVGLIYKNENVQPTGTTAILDSSIDPRFVDTKNRPVLIQSFIDGFSGQVITIAVNHLKSKGSSCADIGDPEDPDGQGNCNQTRTQAAEALADYLATDPTGAGSAYNLIIGDLNAYAMEDPIRTIESAGYTNLIKDFVGMNAYSYVFDGQSGYLDHALSNEALTPFITGVEEWHINSDEPRALDYNEEFKSPGQVTSFYAPDAYRSSDHDPVIVGITFEPVSPPVCYAEEVVEFKQGRKRNGWKISQNRSNPENALGQPQENDTYNFVSLGFGGSITFKLTETLYDDGTYASEFIIVETSFGQADQMCFEDGKRNYPEQAFVEVSGDHVKWYSLPNSYCRTSFVDLSPAFDKGL